MRSRPRLYKFISAFAFCLAIIPAVLILTVILKYGVDVPYWDEWYYAEFFVKLSQKVLTLKDLFALQNEYRQFFPNLIFVGLGWLTNWNKRYELLVSFALACIVSFNLYQLGKLTIGGNSLGRMIIYFLTNLLVFSPIQDFNWLTGMQIVYFVPIACLTTCLVIAYSRLSLRAKIVLGICLAVISTFSSANGLVCWLVLPLLIWPTSRKDLVEKKWMVLIWVVAAIGSIAFYFNGYHKPPAHPSVAEGLIHPLKAAGYFLILLGKAVDPGDAIFISNLSGTGHRVLAAAVGLAMLVLFTLSALYAKRDTGLTHRAAGWLMLGTYSILTGILITIGRVGFGTEQALSLRYTTFTLYLPIALVHLVPMVLKRRVPEGTTSTGSKLLISALVTSVIISNLVIYPHHTKQLIVFSTKLSVGKACLLFINVIEDDCVKTLFPKVDYLKMAANKLDSLNFLRPGLIKSSRVQDIAAANPDNPGSHGSLDSMIHKGENVYTASGWAVLAKGGDPADAILLAYDRAAGDSVIFALADTGGERMVAARFLGMGSPSHYAWQKQISINNLPGNPVTITAWAFNARLGKAVQLDGKYVIYKTAGPNSKPDHDASKGQPEH